MAATFPSSGISELAASSRQQLAHCQTGSPLNTSLGQGLRGRYAPALLLPPAGFEHIPKTRQQPPHSGSADHDETDQQPAGQCTHDAEKIQQHCSGDQWGHHWTRREKLWTSPTMAKVWACPICASRNAAAGTASAS